MKERKLTIGVKVDKSKAYKTFYTGTRLFPTGDPSNERYHDRIRVIEAKIDK